LPTERERAACVKAAQRRAQRGKPWTRASAPGKSSQRSAGDLEHDFVLAPRIHIVRPWSARVNAALASVRRFRGVDRCAPPADTHAGIEAPAHWPSTGVGRQNWTVSSAWIERGVTKCVPENVERKL